MDYHAPSSSEIHISVQTRIKREIISRNYLVYQKEQNML